MCLLPCCLEFLRGPHDLSNKWIWHHIFPLLYFLLLLYFLFLQKYYFWQSLLNESFFFFFNFDISIQLRVTAKHACAYKSPISFFVRYMALVHSRVLPNCRGSNHFLFFTISFSLTFIQSLRLYKSLENEIVESIKHNKTISEKVETEKIFASIKLK